MGGGLNRPEEGIGSPELELQLVEYCLMQAMETKLRSPGRAVHACKHGTFSPSLT